MWFLFHRLQDCIFLLLLSALWWLRLSKRLDGRLWWWVELTVAVVLSKTLIHLTVDGWGWVPSLLVVLPEATQHWSLPGLFGGANDRLWGGSCQGVLPELLLPVSLSPW